MSERHGEAPTGWAGHLETDPDLRRLYVDRDPDMWLGVHGDMDAFLLFEQLEEEQEDPH